MIYATLDYKGEFERQHRLLHKILANNFAEVQEGLQCDSWISVQENGEEVWVDSFTSMKHEVKAKVRNSELAIKVIKVLEKMYDVTVHDPPEFEGHE